MKECFIREIIGIERNRPNHEWPVRTTWRDFDLKEAWKLLKRKNAPARGIERAPTDVRLRPPPPGLEGTAGPPVSRSDKCSRRKQRGDLARCSHASGRRDIPSRAFSCTLARFFIIFPPSAFQGEEQFRRALLRRRGKILVLSAWDSLAEESDRRAADSLRRDALTSGVKAWTSLSVTRRIVLFCSFVRRCLSRLIVYRVRTTREKERKRPTR